MFSYMVGGYDVVADDFPLEEEFDADDLLRDTPGEVDSEDEMRNDDENIEGELHMEQDLLHDTNFFIDSDDNIRRIDFLNMSPAKFVRYSFLNVDLAYDFYNKYASTKGFYVRKGRTRRLKSTGGLGMQFFVCYREGFRDEKHYRRDNRKKEPCVETRCGCSARIQVRFHDGSNRWIFSDMQNHDCLNPRMTKMLRGQRGISEAEMGQINNMRGGGVSVAKIYRVLARQSGGYENIVFELRDVHNRIAKMRREGLGDAAEVLAFLYKMESKDPALYFRYEVDAKNQMKKLFWCDGRSRLDYGIFGDIVAFDATYKKNRYRCPVIVFSIVNYHNQLIVFGVGITCEEGEMTYV